MDLKLREENLTWFVDLSQTDLITLSEGRRLHLDYQLSLWSGVRFLMTDDQYSTIKRPLFSTSLVSKIQNELRVFIDDLLKQGKNDRQIVLPSFPEFLILKDSQYQIGTDRKQFYGKPLMKNGVLKFKSSWLEIIINILKRELARLLVGLPGNVIRQCDECQKLFVHLSGKKKVYCSTKCSYRFLSRKRREKLKKQPRKYKSFLKKQREAMHKVYEKRRKSSLGPNVQVKRNGRKEG